MTRQHRPPAAVNPLTWHRRIGRAAGYHRWVELRSASASIWSLDVAAVHVDSTDWPKADVRAAIGGGRPQRDR